MALLVCGVAWAFASPAGSSADDDYHLTSIWCAHGYSDYCKDSGGEVGVFVPKIVAYPACYVTWPASTSAACVSDLDYSPVYTTRVDATAGGYPDGFYWAMGWLAGRDVAASVQVMRIANVAVASALLLLATLLLQPSISRAVVLAWSVGIIPLGIFFIASTNPSSWVITGVGLYWALLLSLVKERNAKRVVFWLRLVALLVTAVLALSARSDAGIYLLMSTVAVFIAASPEFRAHWKLVLPVGTVLSVGLVGLAFFGLRNRYSLDQLVWPGAQTATDQPNPVVKTLMEIPGFVVGLLGGQRPGYVLSDSGFNQGVDGYRPTGLLYGLGWTDVELPSIVSVLGLFAAAIVVAVGLASYRISRLIAVVFVTAAVVAQILIMRSMVGFTAFWEIQPRYFIPICLAILGLVVGWPKARKPIMTRAQAVVVGLCISIGGSVAWMATAARYAVGPDAAYTNFGQPADWWWGVGPSRLVWFLLAMGATALWAWATVWNFGTKPVCFEDRTPVRTNSLD